MLLNFTEARGGTIDGYFVCLLIFIIFIFHTIIYEVENQFIHVQAIFLLKGEYGFMVKEECQ